MPPKLLNGEFLKRSKRSRKQGEIVISQVEESKVREDGMLEKKDGTTISMVNPKAYQALMAAKKAKSRNESKIEKKRSSIRNGNRINFTQEKVI